MKDNDHEERRRWHVGKEIPVSVLLVLIIQTFGIVWWARGLTAEVATNTSETLLLRTDLKTLNTSVTAQTLPIINAAKIVALERELVILHEEVKAIRSEQAARISKGR